MQGGACLLEVADAAAHAETEGALEGRYFAQQRAQECRFATTIRAEDGRCLAAQQRHIWQTQ